MDDWFLGNYLPLDTLGRLLAAAVAGALLGWERELQDKPAGLRTHMLVALGAAVFMVATLDYLDTKVDKDVARYFDPLRVVAGVIGGIGFLGAGAIIQSAGNVHGMTTAASIWIAAAIGIAAGLGMYGIAFASVIIALVILVAMRVVERDIVRRDPPEERPPVIDRVKTGQRGSG